MSVEDRTKPETEKNGSRRIASCQKLGPMIPAQQLASRTDVFGQTLTRPSRSDLGQFCAIWPMPSLEKQNWNGCCMLAVMAITKMLLDWICHVYWEHLLTFTHTTGCRKHSNSQYHWLQKTFKLPADYSHKVAQQVTQSFHSCLLCIWVHHHVLIIDCTATSNRLKMSI